MLLQGSMGHFWRAIWASRKPHGSRVKKTSTWMVTLTSKCPILGLRDPRHPQRATVKWSLLSNEIFRPMFIDGHFWHLPQSAGSWICSIPEEIWQKCRLISTNWCQILHQKSILHFLHCLQRQIHVYPVSCTSWGWILLVTSLTRLKALKSFSV
jgi:hypothetical protein